MNEIIPNLWLGAYPSIEDVPHLLRSGIRSVLTVDFVPLPEADFKCFQCKFIELRDEPSQDVLDILEESLDFIDQALHNGAVLIHCTMGMSRSATITIAYVMRKFHISYDNALDLVMKRRTVYPNIGFVNQLKLFEVMKWKVDKESPVYRQYAAIRKFKGAGAAYNEQMNSDADLPRVECQPAIFKCRKCRRRLFTSSNLVGHCKPEPSATDTLAANTIQSDDANVNTVLIKGVTLNDSRTPCTLSELFTDPLEWTRPYTHEVEGKLYCPGCRAKVGSFNWCGEPCVCGTWVTPAFHFNRNHLDRVESNSRQSLLSAIPASVPEEDPTTGVDSR
ncbi:Dual specificity protein phosphatase 12 [Fasciola gigantica]|uniref:Dual specificity protein phosphatase 12 n=1 Tax=Fasciola gigantica TaxID=46835 RepID=A0A504Y6T8_FASGI|nr:Dual specificity protein phosphatase 12 [Fasciola gigantica]